MLSGFKICCPALSPLNVGKYLAQNVYKPSQFHFYIYLCMLPQNLLYAFAQIGAITRTAPFQTLLGVGSSQTATTLGPLAIGESLSLLWATSSQALPGLFRTSWGHRALLEFPLSHKVTTLGRTNLSATRIKQKKNHREPLSLTFSRNKYLELLLYLLTYRLFWKDNQEVDFRLVGPGTIRAGPVPWMTITQKFFRLLYNRLSLKLGVIVQGKLACFEYSGFLM